MVHQLLRRGSAFVLLCATVFFEQRIADGGLQHSTGDADYLSPDCRCTLGRDSRLPRCAQRWVRAPGWRWHKRFLARPSRHRSNPTMPIGPQPARRLLLPSTCAVFGSVPAPCLLRSVSAVDWQRPPWERSSSTHFRLRAGSAAFSRTPCGTWLSSLLRFRGRAVACSSLLWVTLSSSRFRLRDSMLVEEEGADRAVEGDGRRHGRERSRGSPATAHGGGDAARQNCRGI